MPWLGWFFFSCLIALPFARFMRCQFRPNTHPAATPPNLIKLHFLALCWLITAYVRRDGVEGWGLIYFSRRFKPPKLGTHFFGSPLLKYIKPSRSFFFWVWIREKCWRN
jgi:hypothetical protein